MKKVVKCNPYYFLYTTHTAADWRNRARIKRLKGKQRSSELSSPSAKPFTVHTSKPSASSLTAGEKLPRSGEESTPPIDSKRSSGSGGSEEEFDGDAEKRSLDERNTLELSPRLSPSCVRAVSTSVGLSAIAHYADSSGDDTGPESEDEGEDSGSEKKGEGGEECVGSRDNAASSGGKLEIPAVIQGRLNIAAHNFVSMFCDRLVQHAVMLLCTTSNHNQPCLRDPLVQVKWRKSPMIVSALKNKTMAWGSSGLFQMALMPRYRLIARGIGSRDLE